MVKGRNVGCLFFENLYGKRAAIAVLCWKGGVCFVQGQLRDAVCADCWMGFSFREIEG